MQNIHYPLLKEQFLKVVEGYCKKVHEMGFVFPQILPGRIRMTHMVMHVTCA